MYPHERHPLKMKHIPAPPPLNFLLFCANEVRAGGVLTSLRAIIGRIYDANKLAQIFP